MEVESQITREYEWAKKTWLKMLSENEEMRLELQKGSAPAHLVEHLANIPSTERPTRSLWGWPLSAVASALFGALLFLFLQKEPETDLDLVQGIAMMAANDHLVAGEFELEAPIPEEVCAKYADRMPFHIVMPRASEAKLLGTRLCRWQNCHSLLTRWGIGKEKVSLILFCPRSQGLPSELGRQVVHHKKGSEELDIYIWAQGGRGYAVAGHSRALKQNQFLASI